MNLCCRPDLGFTDTGYYLMANGASGYFGDLKNQYYGNDYDNMNSVLRRCSFNADVMNFICDDIQSNAMYF